MPAPMRGLLVAVFAIALLPATVATAQSPATKLASDPGVSEALDLLELWLDTRVAFDRIPGLSIGIVHDQELVWAKGFGHADVESRVPATPQTIYSICSISKLFTSLGVMQLRDAGALRLDDPVAKHLSWFKLHGIESDAPEITLLGLLTHSAGLPREADLPYWADATAVAVAGQPPEDYAFPTRDDVMRRLPGQEPYFDAWSYHQYSNLGLTLAGEIVAARSGLEWGDYVQRSILDPLGMTQTFTEMPAAHRGGRLATGYSAMTRHGDRLIMPFFQARGLRPAFGMASTVEDLARFASWHFRVLDHRTSEVLNGHSLAEMHRVHWMDPDGGTRWGIGYTVNVDDGKSFVGHGGSCPGHRTSLSMQTREKIATIAMSNGHDVNPGQFARMAYRMLGPALRKAADSTARPRQADPSLQKYVGHYGNGIQAGSAVVVWQGELTVVPLSSSDPLSSMMKLRHVGGDTFRRVRSDGELAEPIRFEIGPDGRATRYIRFEGYSNRIE